MNEIRPSSARAPRAARRNYLVLCVVSAVAMAAPIVAFILLSD